MLRTLTASFNGNRWVLPILNFVTLGLITVCLTVFGKADAKPSAAHPFGLGLVIGAPTGITAKYLLNRKQAIDAALAWDLGDSHFHIHSNFLWHNRQALELDEVKLDVHYGVGARIVSYNRKPHSHDDDFRLGVRGPVGLGYTFQDPRIEAFGELALIMNFIESTSLGFDAGLGARYYF